MGCLSRRVHLLRLVGDLETHFLLLGLLAEDFQARVGPVAVRQRGGQQIGALVELLLRKGQAQFPLRREPLARETHLADRLDARDNLHRLDRLHPQVAVVPDRRVAALLEIKGGINGHLLPVQLAVRLRPLELARVVLGLEMLVAL